MINLPELRFIDTVMTTIVFYGSDENLSIKEAKKLIESICHLLDEMPSNAHVGLDESGQKSRRPKWNMVDKAIANGDFDDYSYFEAANYFEKGNLRDLSLKVCLTYSAPGPRFEIEFKRERPNSVDISSLLQEVLKYLSPQYGIMYGMTVREGPSWFASGVVSSGMPEGMWQASVEFRNEYFFGKKFTDGFFRDVFKWNYLSPVHLKKTIEGTRFQDWIEEPLKKESWIGKAKSRGTLTFLDNGCAVWELTKDEGAGVRPRMLRAGILMIKT
jgi:hypothetical protein